MLQVLESWMGCVMEVAKLRESIGDAWRKIGAEIFRRARKKYVEAPTSSKLRSP